MRKEDKVYCTNNPEQLVDVHMIQSLNPESIVNHMGICMAIMLGSLRFEGFSVK